MAALYFVAVAAVASLFGQHVVRRLIIIMGRASLIIFILAFTIFVSAVLLGKDMTTLNFLKFQATQKFMWNNVYLLTV